MMIMSDRYPGQMLPVGARWHGNAGAPIQWPPGKAISGPDGIGDTTSVMTGAALVVAFTYRAALGYYIGSKLASRENKKPAAVVGALSTGFLGVTGAAITALAYGRK